MIGVKELLKGLGPKIDWEKKAKQKAKDLGVSADSILKEWEEARNKGIYKGNSLHEFKQKEYEDQDNYIRYDYVKTDPSSFIYDPLNYVIEEGYIYDEKPFVHPKYPLIGIPDRVKVIDNKVYIDDFKSDKAIYKTAKLFKIGKFYQKYMFQEPISHIDWCNYREYNLQLSLYMRLILDNNRKLRPGTMRILHTIHDEDTLMPIEEVIYEVPYLRKEVTAILKKLK